MDESPDRYLNRKHPQIFYRIGAISLQWNRAEYYLEQLLETYLDLHGNIADIVIDTWGNETRATILKRLIVTIEKDAAFSEYANHITKYFNVCRENRNFVVHGIVRSMNDESFIISRFTRRKESRADYCVTVGVLEEIEAELIKLCAHLSYLIRNNAQLAALSIPRGPLPDIPLLPRKLMETQKPIQTSEDHPQEP